LSRRQIIQYAINEAPSMIYSLDCDIDKAESEQERLYAVDALIRLDGILLAAIDQNKKSKQAGSKFKAKQLDAIYNYYSEVCTKIAENKDRGLYG